MTQRITFSLNGRAISAELDPHRTLLDVLRADYALHGPKYGCGMAQCGACMVLVDGRPARACVMKVARVADRVVTTLEGLAQADGTLHPVQQGFVDRQGAQCGYCLNGMMIGAVALLAQNPDPDEAEIRQALRDNLCRCGTHQEIIAAVRRAAVIMKEVSDV